MSDSLLLTGDAGDVLDNPELIGALPEADRLRLNRDLDDKIARMRQEHTDAIREREQQLKAESDERLALARTEAERERVASVIQAQRDGIPAEGVENMQAREKLQDLRLSALTGSDENKDGAWHLETAAEVVRLHQEARRAAGGDDAQRLPDLGLADREPGSPWGGGYNPDRLFLTMYDQVQEQGDKFSAESFTGCPEAEMTKDILKQPFAAAEYAKLTREAKPGQRVIPIPAAIMRAENLRLAETYAEAVAAATATSAPDYRRDLLVHHFRPIDRLAFLGVMEETVSNDFRYSRISAAPDGAWVAENAAVTDSALTLVTGTTSAKRMAVTDSVSWMRLAGADRDFGITPVVTTELMRGCRQTREAAVYGGTNSNGPTGLGGVTGVLAGVIGGTDGNTAPTYTDVLGMLVDIADGDIPIDMLRWITSWQNAAELATILTFASSSSMFAVPLYRASDIGVGMGTIANFPAALTSQVPTNLNSGAETVNDEHAIIAGVWPYLIVVDYATMFVTIDDISAARTGSTLITVNSYHDIAPRVPAAFSYGEFMPG